VTEPTVQDEGAEERELLEASEVRVLAVLAEKEMVTPDTYPMSLNALVNGCNQLSSRAPVMSLSEDAVLEALEQLVQKRLVSEVRQAGARVVKYEHRIRMKWTLEQDKLAVLVLLMLRGTQTAGELRARSGRLHDFATVGDVEAGLQFLIDKYPPLVARLTRSPGTKEVRYAHLLSGRGALTQDEAAEGSSGVSVRLPSERMALLEADVAALRAEVERLSQQLGTFKKQFE
jgi:uncharacterized protein